MEGRSTRDGKASCPAMGAEQGNFSVCVFKFCDFIHKLRKKIQQEEETEQGEVRKRESHRTGRWGGRAE